MGRPAPDNGDDFSLRLAHPSCVFGYLLLALCSLPVSLISGRPRRNHLAPGHGPDVDARRCECVGNLGQVWCPRNCVHAEPTSRSQDGLRRASPEPCRSIPRVRAEHTRGRAWRTAVSSGNWCGVPGIPNVRVRYGSSAVTCLTQHDRQAWLCSSWPRCLSRALRGICPRLESCSMPQQARWPCSAASQLCTRVGMGRCGTIVARGCLPQHPGMAPPDRRQRASLRRFEPVYVAVAPCYLICIRGDAVPADFSLAAG